MSDAEYTPMTAGSTLAIRSRYPHLETSCYLNTAATGLVATGTGAAVARLYDHCNSRGFDAEPEWAALARRAREKLSTFLSVPEEGISFASSSTDALNRAIQALPVRPGDRFVLPEQEFPSLDAVIAGLPARGAVVKRVAIAAGSSKTEVLCAEATRADYICVSHVDWRDGETIDLEALSAACRASGARLVVDGVHAVGAIRVDAKLADVYVTSFFKWMLAGFGLGAAIVGGPLRDEMTPLQVGYANLPPSRWLQHSHVNYAGIAALDFAMDHMSRIGWKTIFARVEMLRLDLIERLAADGIAVAGRQNLGAGIVSVPVRDAEIFSRRLDAEGVRVSARGGAIRVSPHFYNDILDNARFCEAFTRLHKDLQQ